MALAAITSLSTEIGFLVINDLIIKPLICLLFCIVLFISPSVNIPVVSLIYETNEPEIINDKDKTYSPLALYFLIDNNLISSVNEANEYFDIIINKDYF